jgi:hypothetical protein
MIGAAGGEIVEGQAAVEAVAGDHRARRAADLHGGGVFAANHLQQLANLQAVREFVDAGIEAVPGNAEQLGAVAALFPHVEEPLRAAVEDPGGVAERLDIVDDCRIAQIAAIDGEWRPGLRFARQPLARTDQRPFLAADIGAGAHLDAKVEVETADAHDILAEKPALTAVVSTSSSNSRR